MNEKDIIAALNGVDPQMVADAAPGRKRIRPWLTAACLVLAVTGGILGVFQPWQLRRVNLGGMTRVYRNALSSAETALIFPWEYMPAYERYQAMEFHGEPYRTRARQISEDLLTEQLGVSQVSGYDIYSESAYTAEAPVHGIRGIDSSQLLAVELEGKCYVYQKDAYAPQATLGELMASLSLPDTLVLQHYSRTTQKEAQYRQLETEADSAAIFEILLGCSDAPYLEEDPWYFLPEGSVSFTATSEALGIYKKVFSVSPEGYLLTNIMEYGYTYYIGQPAAAEILAYAEAHSIPAKMEPYEYRLAGTVTEIGEGYLLLNDGITAVGGKGMTFRVPTEDLTISRWLDFGGIGVGDLIVVSYTGGIAQDGTNTVCNPTALAKAFLMDGVAAVPE